MYRAIIGLVFIILIGSCGRGLEPAGPYWPFVGEWIGFYEGQDSTWAWGTVMGYPIRMYLPYTLVKKVYYRFEENGQWAGCGEVISKGTKSQGWTGAFRPWETKTNVVWHGYWLEVGDGLLRLVVSSVEKNGRWDIYPGQELTVQWEVEKLNMGRLLLLKWRDEDFLFGPGSQTTELREVTEQDEVDWPVLTTAKPVP